MYVELSTLSSEDQTKIDVLIPNNLVQTKKMSPEVLNIIRSVIY
jgi:hypothetical protein